MGALAGIRGLPSRRPLLPAVVALLAQLVPAQHAQLLPTGPRLRDLAAARNPPLLIGTDLIDSFPFPATGNPDDCVDGNSSAPGCTANASYAAIAADEFSSANADFSLVWIEEQPTSADVFDFNGSDLILAFMRDSNLTYAHINAVLPSGHNVLSGCCVPRWLTDGYPYAAATRTNYTYNWTQTQVRGFIQRRIEVSVPRWLNSGVEVRGIFPVNEAVANQPFVGRGGWPNTWLYGPEENIMSWAFGNSTDYFGQIFRWVRAAADKAGHPEVRLFYNDYGIETPGPKADAVLKWLIQQRALGVPIDGIGFQSHLPCDCKGAAGCNDTAVVEQNMRRFVEAGFQVWVTELDVKMQNNCTLDNQAAVFDAVLAACLAIKAHCDSFMVWGISDTLWSPTQWLAGQAPALFDADYHPKPAYFAVQKRLAEA